MSVELEQPSSPHPFRVVLEAGAPINEQMEGDMWGPAYEYMRRAGHTPLGVLDVLNRWAQTRAAGYTYGVADSLYPTADETEQLRGQFAAGRYLEVAHFMDERSLQARALAEEEDQQFAEYKTTHPSEKVQYETLRQAKKRAAKEYSQSLADSIDASMKQTPYGITKQQYEDTAGAYRLAYASYNSYAAALKGETIED